MVNKLLANFARIAFLCLFALSLHAVGPNDAQTGSLSVAQIKEFAATFQGTIELKDGVTGKGQSAAGKPFAYLVKKIGEGGFGDIFMIALVSNGIKGSLVAKVIRSMADEAVLQAVKNLSLFEGNKHFLKYYGMITDIHGLLAILLETGGKNLDDIYIRAKEKPLPLGVLFHQITDALIFMHKNGYVHLDLKAANMLLGLDKIAKVIDTDGAVDVTKKSKTPPPYTTSPGYTAPEIINEGYSTFLGGQKEIDWREADIYSLGATFLTLLVQKSLSDTLVFMFPEVREAREQYLAKKISAVEYRAALNKIAKEGKLQGALKKTGLNDGSDMFKLIIKMVDFDPTKGHRPDIYDVKAALNKIYPQKVPST